MKFSRYFEISLLCLFISVYGCARSSDLTMQTYLDVFGRPHILSENVCYYFSSWGPGAHVLKIDFKGDTILHYQTRLIDETDLHYYIPLLIEMLNTDYRGDGIRSYMYLISIMRMVFPNKSDWTGTPFAWEKGNVSRTYRFDETTYQEWKVWYDTEGHVYFEHEKTDKNKEFY